MVRSGRRNSILFLTCAALLWAGCSPDRGTSPSAATRASIDAERLANGDSPQSPPFETSLVAPIGHCVPGTALQAMQAKQAAQRAAGALCAARVLPCADHVDPALAMLETDTVVAAEYTNRGPLMGSGDQHVTVSVGQIARHAVDDYRRRCRNGG